MLPDEPWAGAARVLVCQLSEADPVPRWRPAPQTGPAAPPLHFHLSQTETFQVLEGTYGFIVNGAYLSRTASDGPLVSKAKEVHTFFPSIVPALAGKPGDVFKCRVSTTAPREGEACFGEDFYRNFQSYLRDCEKASPRSSAVV